jgi:hypothetical protein
MLWEVDQSQDVSTWNGVKINEMMLVLCKGY